MLLYLYSRPFHIPTNMLLPLKLRQDRRHEQRYRWHKPIPVGFDQVLLWLGIRYLAPRENPSSSPFLYLMTAVMSCVYRNTRHNYNQTRIERI